VNSLDAEIQAGMKKKTLYFPPNMGEGGSYMAYREGREAQI